MLPEKAGCIPAVQHIDGTARIQTINRQQHPLYYNLIKAFQERTGVPVLVNTSFNTRGEPMMHPRFFDMVEYAFKRGVQVSTNSNLTLLNDRRAGRCVTSGLDSLQISIDGSSAETYERIRARAHFDRVVANLERVLAARQRLASATPRLRLVMVMMRRNLHELPDLARFAHRYCIESIFVQHRCHDFGEATLPEQYLPMRDFVQSETLLEEDPQRIDHYFGEARKRELSNLLNVLSCLMA